MKRERSYKPREEEKKETQSQRISRIFISIITTLCAAMLALTAVSAYIEPTQGTLLPVLALIAPALYVANFILMLYWVIRWRWRMASVPLVVLLLTLVFVPLYIKTPLTKDYNTKSYRSMPKMMSYNVRAFLDTRGRCTAQQVASFIETERSDIIAIQEYNESFDPISKEYAPSLAKYNRVRHNGLVVLSRYPIVGSEALFEGDEMLSTSSLRVDLLISGDTVRLFNNHLLSTTIKADDNNYLTSSKMVRDSARHSVIRDIFARYRNSCIERARQANAIAEEVERSPYPTIVCGDFNDPPASYTYTRMSRGLRDAFRRYGSDYSYTYQGFFNTLRIDYILTSKRISPESYRVAKEITVSDHLPVIAHLKIEKE
ncbi:MAG: endonuclease/exonuclease/phosphatase family protein [Rikenellaceae bacterium]